MIRTAFCIFGLVVTAAVLSADPPARSPWGISSSAHSAAAHTEWLPKLAEAGVTSARLFPAWRSIERKQGEFDWSRTDALVKTASDNHFELTGLLFGSHPDEKRMHTFPMDNLPLWSKYAGALAERYRDKIHDWEVWNEGNGGFNGGKHGAEDYAVLVTTAYDAVKKSDPHARIGLSVASFDLAYLRRTILTMKKRGEADKFDFLCIHPYELAGLIDRPDGEIAFLWMKQMTRDMLKEVAPNRADAELWITEVGRPVEANGKHPFSEKQAAELFVKVHILAVAQGIAKIQWFEGMDPAGEPPGFGLLDGKGTPRVAYHAYRTLIRTLGTTPKPIGWLTLGDDERGYGFVFEGKSGPVLVAWRPVGTSEVTIEFTKSVKCRLMDGSEPKETSKVQLGGTPVMLESLPDALLEKARCNATKPYPWGGNFTKNDLVSYVPENKKSNGVTLLTDRPMVTFPDGTSGVLLSGDIRDHCAFAVHPSFANINQKEYHIRVHFRRVGTGGVGMNLKTGVAERSREFPYEAVGGWFTLPKGSGWQTHTWKTTHASFGKDWGTDIQIVPEQSSPFVIGKVEVSTRPFAK